AVMINELNTVFDLAKDDPDIRVVVLTGKGKSFCAGADLNWMKEIVKYSFEQNLEESMNIAELMHKIYALPKPTIAMVNGAAIGGGTGFVSASDIAIASDNAKFGLSEVKIGLVPAAISPYVVRKIGESKAREYFLTGKRISAQKAKDIGLVNDTIPFTELGGRIDALIEQLVTSGPEAIACCKELLIKVPRMQTSEVKEFTARMIANLRVSEEGQEGMAAFLEKRKPKWME
ncbi:MAG: enoyl-CoA hydratase/isomerase family protein, partial [Candidatus Aminicenantes bacterium]|nr:enoyl-CoA hydratase/isomerase family protein [Candidatus Aminicenantes bacterium]